jgi:hypothetical protein
MIDLGEHLNEPRENGFLTNWECKSDSIIMDIDSQIESNTVYGRCIRNINTMDCDVTMVAMFDQIKKRYKVWPFH